MATPQQPVNDSTALNADQKASLLLAITQLDMLATAFGKPPKRVLDATVEFKEALKEWAGQ